MDKITFNIMDDKKKNFQHVTLEKGTNMTEVLNAYIDQYLEENKEFLNHKINNS